MSTIRAIKTVTNTEASLFAGTSELAGRTFLRIRNMDDVMSIVVAGRTMEPGEINKFNLIANATPIQKVYGKSNGRAVEVEVIEG